MHPPVLTNYLKKTITIFTLTQPQSSVIEDLKSKPQKKAQSFMNVSNGASESRPKEVAQGHMLKFCIQKYICFLTNIDKIFIIQFLVFKHIFSSKEMIKNSSMVCARGSVRKLTYFLQLF